MKTNQKGFGAVEAILIIILLAILGFGGWYVWNQQKDSKKDDKKTSQSEKKAKASSKKEEANKNVVKFPEIGIQLTVPDSIKDLKYIIDEQTDPDGRKVMYVRLTSDTMLAKDADCTAAGSSLGVITRGQDTYPPAGASQDTIGMYYGGFTKQFNTFFIGYSKSQAVCGSADVNTAKFKDVSALQLSLEDDIKAAMTTAKEL